MIPSINLSQMNLSVFQLSQILLQTFLDLKTHFPQT